MTSWSFVKIDGNRNIILDPFYVETQETLHDVCRELGLQCFYPDYHAKDHDCNTVLIYTKEDADYNYGLDLKLLEGEFIPDSSYKKPVCSLENTDHNGHFNLHYFNHGAKELHWDSIESDIKIFLRGRLADFKS